MVFSLAFFLLSFNIVSLVTFIEIILKLMHFCPFPETSLSFQSVDSSLLFLEIFLDYIFEHFCSILSAFHSGACAGPPGSSTSSTPSVLLHLACLAGVLLVTFLAMLFFLGLGLCVIPCSDLLRLLLGAKPSCVPSATHCQEPGHPIPASAGRTLVSGCLLLSLLLFQNAAPFFCFWQSLGLFLVGVLLCLCFHLEMEFVSEIEFVARCSGPHL